MMMITASVAVAAIITASCLQHTATQILPQEMRPNEVGETTRRNASSEAYRAFQIYLSQNGREPGGNDDGNEQIVFINGDVQNQWLPQSTRDAQENHHLFHHDEYADRISFSFAFGSFQVYDIRRPISTSSDESVARPQVVEFQIDAVGRSGSFSVVYDCQHRTDNQLRNISVSVVVPIVPGLSAFYSFSKSCGGGIHKHMKIGYIQASDASQTKETMIPFEQGANWHIVEPHVASTKVYIALSRPATSQEFFHITANTSDQRLGLQTRGPTFGGVLRAGETSTIQVVYDCHGTGKANISLQVPIYPFEPLSAAWAKDCGGGLATGLSVGTSEWTKNDVVQEAVTTEDWSLALWTTSPRISTKAPVVNDTVRFKDFWLSNDAAPVLVEPEVVTVENPAVLAAFSLRRYQDHLHQAEGGHLLASATSFRLRVQMICKRKGTSLVTIALPIRSFSNIEFGFVKECKAPIRWVSSSFLQTANSVMVTFSFVVVGSFAYYYVARPHRTNQHGKPGHSYRRLRAS